MKNKTILTAELINLAEEVKLILGLRILFTEIKQAEQEETSGLNLKMKFILIQITQCCKLENH
jgi:hypothetical protein